MKIDKYCCMLCLTSEIVKDPFALTAYLEQVTEKI